jgi:hypothetical protein
MVKADANTGLLNVDLDIVSNRDLQPLLAAFGKEVFVLYSARHGS